MNDARRALSPHHGATPNKSAATATPRQTAVCSLPPGAITDAAQRYSRTETQQTSQQTRTDHSMTTSYDQGLANDRYIAQYGNAHYNATPQPETRPGSQYRRPQPITLERPGAGALTHPANATTSQRAWASAQHAADAFDAYIKSLAPLAGDPRYSEHTIRETIAQFANTAAAQDVERTLQAVQKMAEDTKAAVDRTREKFLRPGDTAAELRNTRYWNRTQSVLDREGAAAIHSIINDAKPEEIGVLLQELPPYLRSRGKDLPIDLDDLVGRHVPEYGVARERAARAEKARIHAETNAKRLRDRYTAAYPSSPGAAGGNLPSVPMAYYDPQSDPELI